MVILSTKLACVVENQGFCRLSCFVKHVMEHKDDEGFVVGGCPQCLTIMYRREVKKAIFKESATITDYDMTEKLEAKRSQVQHL